MILTTNQRRLMTGSEGMPMFARSAPVQSTGKTALVRLMSYLVQGTGLAVTSWPSNDEEIGKHLLAIQAQYNQSFGFPCGLPGALHSSGGFQ